MINIIFNFNPTRALVESERMKLLADRFDFVDRIPEMRIIAGVIPLQATVETLAGMGRVKALLDSLDQRGAITIIGVWRSATVVNIDANGIRTVTEIMEKHPNYVFDLATYKAHLKNIPTYDVNGVENGSRRPTDAEALVTHVNKFAGMPDRILA